MGNYVWDCGFRYSYLVARDGSLCPDGSSGSGIERHQSTLLKLRKSLPI